MLKGIDVSEHQGRIDWNKVKDHVDFVILRAGYGRNNIDKQFIRNIKECNRLGISVGVYWFSYAYTTDMARQEARYCLDAIKPYKVEYPIFFDLEYGTVNYANKQGVNISKRLATDMVKAFCSEIEGANYWAGNYANPDFINNRFYQDELRRYSLWLAWYRASESSAKKYGCEMWQYSESGSIPGISGSGVDMNYEYRGYRQAIREAGLNHLDRSKPVEQNKPFNSNKDSLWKQSITGEEVKALQRELNNQFNARLTVDGYFGNSTLNACITVKEGAQGNITKLIQQRLLNRGYTSLNSHGGADGYFGQGTTQALKNLQKNKGIVVDGIVGRNTWKVLYSE